MPEITYCHSQRRANAFDPMRVYFFCEIYLDDRFLGAGNGRTAKEAAFEAEKWLQDQLSHQAFPGLAKFSSSSSSRRF
jgi:hypothetical protein